jgi:hypothetical protein
MKQNEQTTVGDLITEMKAGNVTKEQVAEAIRPLMEEPGRVIHWGAEVSRPEPGKVADLEMEL